MLEKIILTDMDKTLVDVHDQLTGSIAKTLAFFKKEYDFNILNTTNHLYDYLGSLGIDIDDRNFWGKLDNFENREEGIKSKRRGSGYHEGRYLHSRRYSKNSREGYAGVRAGGYPGE